MARRRLGWLGPVIVAVGVVVALFLGSRVITGKPQAGAVIDTIVVNERTTLVVRAEADGGERNFVERHEATNGEDKLIWQAVTPPYAGRPGAPGIAFNDKTVTVRVIRGGRAEVFALAAHDAGKLGGFKLAPGKGPVVKQTSGPVTLSDHVRSFELVEGTGWHQVVAVDLDSGDGVWKQDLAGDAIEAAGIDQDRVWIQQHGTRRLFRARDGVEESTSAKSPKS
jgi:outer membrane protein assembly factor BamB